LGNKVSPKLAKEIAEYAKSPNLSYRNLIKNNVTPKELQNLGRISDFSKRFFFREHNFRQRK
jgi:hypothetical protein